MKDCNLKEVYTPAEKIADPLTELLRNGARDLIRQAVEAELSAMLSDYEDLKLIDGRPLYAMAICQKEPFKRGLVTCQSKYPRFETAVAQAFIFKATCYHPT